MKNKLISFHPRIFDTILQYKKQEIDYAQLVSKFHNWVSLSNINAPIQYSYPYSPYEDNPIKTGTIVTLAIDYNLPADFIRIILNDPSQYIYPYSICRFSGEPLLTIACRNNSFEISKLLIEKYKESIKNENFWARSILLKEFVNMPTRNLLEETKIEFHNRQLIPGKKVFFKERPIFKALNNELDIRLIKLLLSNGARCDVTDDNGLTPFQYAEFLKRQDIAKMIVFSRSCYFLDIVKYGYNNLFQKHSNIYPIESAKEDNNTSEAKHDFTHSDNKTFTSVEVPNYLGHKNSSKISIVGAHEEPIEDF